MPAENLISGGESFIGYNQSDDVSEKPITGSEGRSDSRERHQIQSEDVGHEPVTIVVATVDALPDPDALLLAAINKLGVTDSPSVPDEHKRKIVEALVVRELDSEEGFLDFSSF